MRILVDEFMDVHGVVMFAGIKSRCGSNDGKYLSGSSSSKVSTISVPTTDGGFGCGFKGWIDEKAFTAAKPGTGMVIAVKKLNQEGFQGHKEWLVSITSALLWLICNFQRCLSKIYIEFSH